MKGTIANVAAVVLGAGAGMMLKKGIPERYQKTVMQGLALSVGIIGIQMAFKAQNILVVIVSIVVGAVLGEWLNIDFRLNQVGDRITRRLGNSYGRVGEGFITASLVYCIGAMAIVGSIQDGLTGDASTLYAKSMLDGISAIIFTAGMGIGVAFSAVSILVYQGSITLLAGYSAPFLSAGVIGEVTAVGGILIVGISLLMLDIKKISVANLIPSIPIVIILANIWR